jgi:iron(III) transport system ATP-binding protein
MNKGRIEQVDDPFTLYTKPKTRFVAGFIGRSNFIEGRCSGQEIVFESFAIPRSAVENGDALSGLVTFSVRPQGMRLARARSQEGRLPEVEVRILECAYLGEFWDYVVVTSGGMRLKVTTPPPEIYEKGESAWLKFDPKQMSTIA